MLGLVRSDFRLSFDTFRASFRNQISPRLLGDAAANFPPAGWLACFCPCMVYASNKRRLEHLTKYDIPEPTRLGGICGSDCLIHAVLIVLSYGWSMQASLAIYFLTPNRGQEDAHRLYAARYPCGAPHSLSHSRRRVFGLLCGVLLHALRAHTGESRTGTGGAEPLARIWERARAHTGLSSVPSLNFTL
jgi:hypothetical protein